MKERDSFLIGETKLIIVGRCELEAMTNKNDDLPKHTYVISIKDSDAPFVRVYFKPKGLLRLSFDDMIDLYDLRETLAPEESSYVEDYIRITQGITEEQARKIARFVIENKDDMECLICQCEMGQSRSSAVAAAVLEYYEGSARQVFDNPRFSPNRLVYEKLFAAFHEQVREKGR